MERHHKEWKLGPPINSFRASPSDMYCTGKSTHTNKNSGRLHNIDRKNHIRCEVIEKKFTEYELAESDRSQLDGTVYGMSRRTKVTLYCIFQQHVSCLVTT